MTVQEFAKMLDGRNYLREISAQECGQAAEQGFVVVFGESDDLTEFCGAIDDEVGCYDGGDIYLDQTGIYQNACKDEHCPYAAKEAAKRSYIRAVWCPADKACSWAYETSIPHATFRIYDEGELYCIGIVFELRNLMP